MDALSQLRVLLKNNGLDPDSYDEEYLNLLIETAKSDYIAARNYPKSYTEQQIQEELEKYQLFIVKKAFEAGSRTGQPFATTVTENGTSRTFEKLDDLPKGVFPFVNPV